MTLTLMLWGASSASAGGPTSVLVTSPGSGKATARYYSDKEYDKLAQLLGPSGTGTRDKPPEADLSLASQINVTWLAHDISPWRLDRVFPVESGPRAVWIHTAANVPENLNGYWHRADHPVELRALLEKMGVAGKASGAGYSGIPPAPWQSQDATATPEADTGTVTVQASVPGAGDDGWAHWWWTLPGLAAGIALGSGGTLLIRRAAARRAAGPPREEPHQELIDL
ncbi:hypothetical protein ACFV0T_10420 [Streptomyces sp. NPDC059582]|uniref:hypothetical protein n=1 Tax=Streptomyces sp. NPDC059582 TaxID=3346875 RepID=UPI0036817BF0